MPRRIAVALLSFALLGIFPTSISGQQHDPAGGRKAIVKIKPDYPELARRLNMSGVVKLGVVIAADGSVKSTKVIGGNPVFIAAAQEAIRRWKYAPASGETTELVELKFENR
jgi:TonB family protein